MGQFEPANLSRMGAGSSTLAAEELALHQVCGKRGAVDDDQRSGAPRAAPVDRRASSSFRCRFHLTTMVASVDAT